MAAYTGRLLAITFDSVELACREKTITVNGEPIDVTDDSSDGWRVLLDDLGVKSVNVSVSGLTKSHVLRGSIGEQATLLATYSEGHPHEDAATFEAEFQSTGEVTFTAPA